MPNPYLPRELVHEWSDAIGNDPENPALPRLLKQQRRLSRWIEENAENLSGPTAGVALYLVGVISRIFDLAGGRLKAATWEQVRAAEKRVLGAVDELLPVDETLPERARAISWRAQPHILDEALMALFDSPQQREDEQELDLTETFKVYLIMWVATEVLDQNWQPPRDFQGETEYRYVHIEPTPPETGEGDGKSEATEAAAAE